MSAKSWRTSKKYAQVLGRRMAYVEQGQGEPIVLLHGNPASSFLWCSVLPELVSLGRCIAPDLIGRGDSAKLPADDLATGQVTLVVHDWGSALGFDWARRHPDRVRRIVYVEAIVRPFADWGAWPEAARATFQKLRSPAGDEVLLKPRLFIEDVLSAWMLRTLDDEELEEYCRPFAAPGEDRLPTLMWLRQVPICGEPAEVVEVVAAYAVWLAETRGIPKLFINAEPGAVLTGAQREFCRTWPD